MPTDKQNKYMRFANLIDVLDIQGHVDLADDIEKIANLIVKYDTLQPKYAFVPELTNNMNVGYLAGEQSIPQKAPELNQEQEISDDEIEEVVSPKDIDNLLNKLEAVMDAMGDDFDPDLIPVAKKILSKLLEKFEQIDSSSSEDEMVEETPIEEPQQYTPPQTPAIASIMQSTVKLAQIANDLEDANFSSISSEIDEIIYDVQKIIKTAQKTNLK